MDGFISARMKLARSAEIATDIATGAEQWSRSASPALSAATEVVHGVPTVVVRAHGLPAVPDRLTLALDDFVHHARSALDHVVWQLAQDAGVASRQAFPVQGTQNGDDFRNSTRGLSEAARQVIRGLQPYTRPQGHEDYVLWVVHQLDIVAKHRSVVPVVGSVETIRYVVPDEDQAGKSVRMQAVSKLDASGSMIVLEVADVRAAYKPPDVLNWVSVPRFSLWVPETANSVAVPIEPELARWVQYFSRIVDSLEAVR